MRSSIGCRVGSTDVAWPNLQTAKSPHVYFVVSKDLKESFTIAKPAKSSHHTAKPRAETALEKTSRIVKDLTEQEAVEHQEKVARLRKARLESMSENATKAGDEKPVASKKST